MPVLVFLGSSVWELCGAQILGFAYKTYIAYNNLPCTTVLACDQKLPWIEQSKVEVELSESASVWTLSYSLAAEVVRIPRMTWLHFHFCHVQGFNVTDKPKTTNGKTLALPHGLSVIPREQQISTVVKPHREIVSSAKEFYFLATQYTLTALTSELRH
jgi:hypothetical protein